ncbi:MAG: hypothetical protein WCD18_13080 [Thermosynechococcaceae cyanobacterium]
MVTQDEQPILWRQVGGLSAILAAATFSWMAYGFFQPKLLQELGFLELAAWLAIIQGSIGAIIEPIVGDLSDRVQHRLGSRLPLITAGVTAAGLIFVSIALLLQWHIPPDLHWIVPVLMTVWVMAMIVFRGPVMGLLLQAAPLSALPQANSLLMVVFGLMGALGPFWTLMFQNVGAAITFMLGAIALMVGGAVLYSGAPRQHLFPIRETVRKPVSWQRMGWLFGVGLGSGLEVNVLLRTFPHNLQTQFPMLGANGITALILLISALSAYPLKWWMPKMAVGRTLLVGCLAIALCQALLLLSLNPIFSLGLILAGGIAFGIVFKYQVPFALGALPPSRAGLGTGLYFGAIGASTAILSLLLLQWGPFGVATGLGVNVGALGIATLSLRAFKLV